MVIAEAGMPEVKPRKRRSKRSIAKEKAAKDARRIERETTRRLRLEEEERQQAARWQAAYDAQFVHERSRAAQRLFQEQGVEWLMGYDTPAAALFERFHQTGLLAVRATEERVQKSRDPLNLMGPAPAPLNKKQQKEQKRLAEQERLARGEYREKIPDLDNPRQDVMVTALAHSFRRMKNKMQVHQQPAAERFLADWESAGYSGLSSMGFDPRVDSSAKPTSGHLRAAEAQTRLKMAEAQIGTRNYDICTGVLILNYTASQIHAMGGRQHRIVSNDIDVALNALAGFYDPIRLARDPTWRAFQRAIEAGLGVIRQGEEEVR
jgi:hypothetical protein